jgi:hypothetical protein
VQALPAVEPLEYHAESPVALEELRQDVAVLEVVR